ncbi:cytidine deaminase-like protein, partial [Coprinopsis sp. MPI-PUGE-AT-0042]
HPQTLCFSSADDLLSFVTSNWRENYVTHDLDTKELVDMFIRRPFFMLISVDAPLLERYRRSLEAFIREDDRLVFGSSRSRRKSSLNDLRDSINIHVLNSFKTVGEFNLYLEALDLLNSEHLRPSWDAYFMTLASLASRRSNCMKRRVGAVLVRDNRVIATGYNGTPRGLRNCNEGGCSHCNGTSPSPSAPADCVCLHAEENALLEAGRERVGQNGVLYCNTCPCLKCTVKIVQTGVKTVVYNLAYKM